MNYFIHPLTTASLFANAAAEIQTSPLRPHSIPLR
jgi:hypothetical protein